MARDLAPPETEPLVVTGGRDLAPYVPPESKKMGGGEAFLHGAGESIPFGRQAQAALVAMMQLGANATGLGERASAGDAYRSALGDEADKLAVAGRDQGLATLGGKVFGGGLSMAALSPLRAGQLAMLGRAAPYASAAGNASLYGILHGYGEGGIKQAAIEGPASGAMGALAEAAAPAARLAGGKLADLAGWLKINSIHPTPLLGEAMEDIPGGVPAVGRLLLRNRIGGLTKQGTADQVGAAFDAAAGKATALAKAHDALGAAPIDIGDALASAQAKAESLMSRPATEEAGQKLKALVDKYTEIHGTGEGALASAQDALTLKRDLGEIGYGAKAEFKLNKNPVTGNYGKGVRQFERGIDAALDDALGPEFEQANLVVRQLGGAKQAAERSAARTTGNTLTGLVPYLAAATGAASSHAAGGATPEAVAYGLAALLAGKYGAQAGARTLYGLGRGLEMMPAGGAAISARFPQTAIMTGNASPALGSLIMSAMARKATEPGRDLE